MTEISSDNYQQQSKETATSHTEAVKRPVSRQRDYSSVFAGKVSIDVQECDVESLDRSPQTRHNITTSNHHFESKNLTDKNGKSNGTTIV